MHLTERAQRKAGTTIVRDALERIGNVGETPPIEELSGPRSLGYRSRARVAIARGRIGFYERGSHRVVDVARCAVLDAPTQSALEELRARRPASHGEIEIRGFGEKAQVGDRLLHVPQGAFFQVNGLLWGEWQRKVAEACGEGRLAVELYGGIGFYTILLESRFDRVIVVDRGPGAQGARMNTRAEVFDADVDHWGPQHLPTLSPDVVLVNPPRAGCSRSVVEAIRDAHPRRLVYVSCDPGTFARDVCQLGADYRVEALCRIDALPQTHHVELLAVLVQA